MCQCSYFVFYLQVPLCLCCSVVLSLGDRARWTPMHQPDNKQQPVAYRLQSHRGLEMNAVLLFLHKKRLKQFPACYYRAQNFTINHFLYNSFTNMLSTLLNWNTFRLLNRSTCNLKFVKSILLCFPFVSVDLKWNWFCTCTLPWCRRSNGLYWYLPGSLFF